MALPSSDANRWMTCHGLRPRHGVPHGGGDDYELLFTAPPAAFEAVESAARDSGVSVARIGSIHAGRGLRVIDERGSAVDIAPRAFDHFRP